MCKEASLPNSSLANTYLKVSEGVFEDKWVHESVSIDVPRNANLDDLRKKLAEKKNTTSWLSKDPFLLKNGMLVSGKVMIRENDSLVAAGLGNMEIPLFCNWDNRVVKISVPVDATFYILKQRVNETFPLSKTEKFVWKVSDLESQFRGDHANDDRWNGRSLVYLGITPRSFEGEGSELDCQITLYKVRKDASGASHDPTGPSHDPTGSSHDPSGPGKDPSGPGSGPGQSISSSLSSLTLKGKSKGGGASDSNEGGFDVFGGEAGSSLKSLKRCRKIEISKSKGLNAKKRSTKKLKSSSFDDAQLLS